MDEAADGHDVMAAHRQVQELHVPALPAHAHVLGGQDADPEAVNVADLAEIEQELEPRLVEEIVHVAAEEGSAVAEDKPPLQLEQRHVSDPAFGNRHGLLSTTGGVRRTTVAAGGLYAQPTFFRIL